MSKQSEAKALQEYAPKGRTCSNCEHYQSELVNVRGFMKEKNKRCAWGGFAIKKMATCSVWLEKG